jgi:hypothetical protein
MAAFDKLPPSARQALQDAAFDWATQPILTKHRHGRRGYMTGADIADSIARWDADEIAKDRAQVRRPDAGPRRRHRKNKSNRRPRVVDRVSPESRSREPL